VARKKRRPSPAFPLYPKDFLGDSNTMTMTAEEVGAYMLLLMHAWEQGATLPHDLDELAALARVDRPRFDDMWATKLSRCFTIARNKRTVSNPRQCREASKQRAYSAQQAAKARHRWDKGDAAAVPGDSRGYAGGMPPTPTPTSPPAAQVNVSVYPPGTCPLQACDGEGAVRAKGGRILRTCQCPAGRERARRFALIAQAEEQAAAEKPAGPAVNGPLAEAGAAVAAQKSVPVERARRAWTCRHCGDLIQSRAEPHRSGACRGTA